MEFTILTDLLKAFASSIPSFFNAVLVIILGWIISRVLSRTIGRLLRTVGIDKLGDRLNDIDLVSKSQFTIVPSKFLAKIIYYVLLLLTITAATDILGIEEVSKLVSNIINYIPLMLSALILMIIGLILADFVKGIVYTACKSIGLPSANIIAGFVFWFIFLTGFVSALAQAQINTSFITSNLTVIIGGGVFAFGLGYGLASKDIMANFLASFYSKDRFNLGDVISIDGVKGEIIAVDKSALTLQTEEVKVIIPLSRLTSETVILHDS
ncbi:MAG: mechanosensitive ion channel domain-containing protein [Bacteroidota bacterium]